MASPIKHRSISEPNLVSFEQCHLCNKYYHLFQGHFDKGYVRRRLCSDICAYYEEEEGKHYRDDVRVRIVMIYEKLNRK